MELKRTVTRIGVGVLATFLWFCTALLAVAADTAPVGPDSALGDLREEIGQLRQQISLSNLLNGLYLSNEQMRQVLAYAKEAEALRQEYRTQNAALGNEKEYRLVPAEKAKRVVVVGGGAAGMEAARVASLRGHEVTLYEKDKQLGGQINTLVKAPGRFPMLTPSV